MAYWSYAVTNTTWVAGHASAAAVATSRPVRPGMRMSRKATSGRCSTIASSALAPSSHSATMSSCGHAVSSAARSDWRSKTSSSAITPLAMGLLLVVVLRHVDGGGDALREVRRDGQAGLAGIDQFQPFARVLQADARAAFLRAETLAVVGHGHRHAAILPAREDPHRAVAGPRLQAVLDRVFHQGLQQHRR